jgi:hypothetical protein
MPENRVLPTPRLKKVKKAARDNWLNRNQPPEPKSDEHPAASTAVDVIKERQDPNE